MNELPESENSLNEPDLETLDYLRGVKSSTCLLLPTTPSPTPLDFQHPLSDQMGDGAFMNLNSEGNGNIHTDNSGGDSSSSGDSNSVVQDPVSAQLINNISMLEYQTLSKNGDLIMGQTDDIKLNGNVAASGRKLPGFVNWNWVLIRKILLWVVLSILVGCLAAIVAMVVTIPSSCNPDQPWHQGQMFYEVFPASFKDSNGDGIGDLRGLTQKLSYIEGLGASAIRLNYIFEASSYPEHYYNCTNLLNIDRSLGTLKDFQDLVAAVHSRNMSLILDIPVLRSSLLTSNSIITDKVSITNDTTFDYFDMTTTALAFWAKAQSVDGFYLKNLENYADDKTFAKTLQNWKNIIGSGKILIANEKALKTAKGDNLRVLLSRMDLIDIQLKMDKGINGLKEQIDNVINGLLWLKPHYPWVLWNIGNIGSERISTKHANDTLALLALEFILPGTINIFYGDEIGLGGLNDVEKDYHEHEYVHNLIQMSFPKDDDSKFKVLSWAPKSALEPKYQNIEVIKQLAKLRSETPTLYLRSIYKEGNILKNMAVRKTDNDLVVIERWYPRRNTCIFVGNLGNKAISTDMSTMFYGGLVVAGTNSSLIGQNLYFDEITFLPNSGIILRLEK